jgi:hypothetical protein
MKHVPRILDLTTRSDISVTIVAAPDDEIVTFDGQTPRLAAELPHKRRYWRSSSAVAGDHQSGISRSGPKLPPAQRHRDRGVASEMGSSRANDFR